ncbi:hypothetical protein MSAN_02020700 [Mycena sanguinolenta]|uniref:Uncharacterized protein n=1 Tax=Mycena sanguinolenta TaxID=230812 RepID=A0A8H7CLZ2_9AGAR|nr:hypothetical protein MSAN_02020700 [Mycena sanguinolenta]
MFMVGSNPSRKYVDLINRASAKYASWDPAKLIRAGDYGKIDRKTGQFQKEGSIYDTHCPDDVAALAARYPPVTTDAVQEFSVSSLNVKKIKYSAGVQVQALGSAGIAGISFQTAWKFGRDRGAFLVMFNAEMTHVPDEFISPSAQLDFLKGKVLVRAAYHCPAYAMYLSNKESETVQLSLDISGPTPVPGLTTEGNLGMDWHHEGTSGLFQKAIAATASYTPLVSLHMIQKPFGIRRESPNPIGETPTCDLWRDVERPWGELTEDGDSDVEETFSDDSE